MLWKYGKIFHAHLTNYLGEYPGKNIRRGPCISTPSSNSKVKHNSETLDTSTSLILPQAPPSTPTSREQNQHPR
ncbi:putative C4 protein [Beet curly top virus]|uniref:Putative C4 protein n=1 Tax=Beet curly top virus TaxID=10840 RepID=H9A539_9GEMI|nr:putative C4 protein [Beet curly top virus]